MATLKVYVDLMGQPSRALMMFCRATNIPHEIKHVKLMRMEHKKSSFKKLTPFQTVRAVVKNFYET